MQTQVYCHPIQQPLQHDLKYFHYHRHVMSPAPFEVSAWQCLKIGAGPIPIETSEGWLLFYHGVPSFEAEAESEPWARARRSSSSSRAEAESEP